MNTCEICGSETRNKRFCSATCYGQWQRGKCFHEQNKSMRAKKVCSICGDTHFGKGYCRKHYRHMIRGEKPRHINPIIKKVKMPKMIKITTKAIRIKNTSALAKKCEHCGKEFFAYMRTNGKEPKFCSSSCFGKSFRKPYIVKKGYKKILLYNHPRADNKGYVFEHIIIAEAMLGRSLKNGEECHHIDGNRINNSASNIKVFASHYDHMQEHRNH